MEKYIEHFQSWQKVWSIKSIPHISVFAYVYVLVLLGGEAKKHALPRGGGGVLCSQSSIFKGDHLPRYGVFYQGRDPIRRVVRLYNWANPASHLGRCSERENWTKIKVLRGGARHCSGFHLKLWEIRMIDRISSYFIYTMSRERFIKHVLFLRAGRPGMKGFWKTQANCAWGNVRWKRDLFLKQPRRICWSAWSA